MAVRIEDAGFEIRDMIAWVYGSGFPKSLNIGKAVDKLQGNEREDLGESENNRDRSKHEYNYAPFGDIMPIKHNYKKHIPCHTTTITSNGVLASLTANMLIVYDLQGAVVARIPAVRRETSMFFPFNMKEMPAKEYVFRITDRRDRPVTFITTRFGIR